jgi:hypothetical protein
MQRPLSGLKYDLHCNPHHMYSFRKSKVFLTAPCAILGLYRPSLEPFLLKKIRVPIPLSKGSVRYFYVSIDLKM